LRTNYYNIIHTQHIEHKTNTLGHAHIVTVNKVCNSVKNVNIIRSNIAK